MATFKIEIRVSGGAWDDVTDYIQAGSWGSIDIVAEDGLLNYTAGNMAFQLIDRDAGKAAHYWIQRLAASTTDAEVRVSTPTTDTDPPLTKTIFYGYVEPGLFTWESDVITAFTATSILAHANKIDAGPARGGQPAIGRYSGGAATLLTALLRKLGCLAGSVADVVVKTIKLGTTQNKADWNHERRYWSDPDVDLDADTISDVYHVCVDKFTAWSFVCKHGRLYRIDVDGTLTEVLNSSNQPYTTTGHRLFRFVTDTGVECLAVVECEKRHSYTHQGKQQSWSPWASGAVAIASLAAMAIPGLQWWGALGISVAAAGAGYGINHFGTSWRNVANGDQFYAVTGVLVVSIGNGTNAAGGVGRAVQITVSPPFAERYKYVPGDAVCIQNLDSAWARIIWTVWNDQAAKATPYMTAYDGANWANDPPDGIPGMGTTECGKPTSMAVIEDNIFLGGTNGCAVAVICESHGEIARETQFLPTQQAIGRFVGTLIRDEGNGNRYAYFVPGNGISTDLAGEARGAAIEQQFKWLGNSYHKNMARPPGEPAFPVPELEPIGLEESLDGFLVVSSHYQPFNKQNDAMDYLSCLYECIDDDNRRLLYHGLLYAWTGGIRCKTHGLSGALCAYPMPNTAGDWRPPVAWYESSQSIYRMLTACAWTDRDALITDIHITSLYAKLNIHVDLDRDPVSIGYMIIEAARSGWLYVRLLSPDACNSADDVRIISRHAWTPVSAGALGKDEVSCSPRVDGIEFYDGCISDIGGQRIEEGSTGVGKTVYSLSGAYLTPALARAMALRVVAEYPRTSAAYPFGRRRFIPDVLNLDDGSDDAPPGYADMFKSLTVTFQTGLDTSAIITAVGINRAALRYPCRLLEYAVAGGVGLGVDWAADEPTSDAVALDYPALVAAVAVVAVESSRILTGWNCTHVLTATVQDNPDNGPCAWAFPIHLPHGATLSGFEFKLTRAGAPGDGEIPFELWSDFGGRPGTRITGARSLVLDTATRLEGLNHADLFSDDLGYPDPALRLAIPPTDLVWLVYVQDRQDGGDVPTVAPPLVWADSLVAGRAFRLSFADLSLPELASSQWLEEWIAAEEVSTHYAPDVQVASQS